MLPDDGFEIPRSIDDRLPPEDRLPQEEAYSLDEFNERLPACRAEEKRKRGRKKLLWRLVTAAVAVAALSLAANQIDPLASKADAKAPVLHDDPIILPTESTEISTAPQVITDEPVTEIPTTEIPSTEIPTTEIPTTEIPTTEVPTTEVQTTEPEPEETFPELDNLDPDWDGDYSWSNEGPELYLRFARKEDANYSYLVRGAAWDTYDPGGKLVSSAEGVSYDPATNTLYLTDCSLAVLDVNLMGNGFTIELSGENEISSVSIWGAGYGGSLKLIGDGSLSVENGVGLNAEGSGSCLMIGRGVTLKTYGIVVQDSTLDEPIWLSKYLTVRGGQVGELTSDDGSPAVAAIVNEDGELATDITIEPIS